MVEIQCPHCDEDVELENDVFGLFDCPHCDEEFAWEDDSDDRDVSNEYTTNPLKISGIKVGFGILLVTAIVFYFALQGSNWLLLLASLVFFGVGGAVLIMSGIMKLNENG